MGYYTKYHLEWNKEACPEPIIAELKKRNLPVFSDSEKDSQWREMEADMRTISLMFPGVLFTLHGHGEEYSDEWRRYFMCGKMQFVIGLISFDPFDIEKAS